MKTITALIAEDEPLLAENLREALATLWPELTISTIAHTGLNALEALRKDAPDVAFLDIRLPGYSGLDIAREAGHTSHIVFITAYDQYAVAAFEQGAVDYVLKPLELPRLKTTIERLKAKIGQAPANLKPVLQNISQPKTWIRWIQASLGNQLRFITVEEVVYFQSDTKYTRVVTQGGEALIKKPIKELVELLDPELFWQIHRSAIINVSQIQNVERDMLGRMTVTLRDRGESLAISKAFQARFKQM